VSATQMILSPILPTELEVLFAPPMHSRAARRRAKRLQSRAQHFRAQTEERRRRRLAATKAVRIHIVVTTKGHKPRPKRVALSPRALRTRPQRAWDKVARREALDELLEWPCLEEASPFVADDGILEEVAAVRPFASTELGEVDSDILEAAGLHGVQDGLPPGYHIMTNAELRGRLAYAL
jgi:hypothetical protein